MRKLHCGEKDERQGESVEGNKPPNEKGGFQEGEEVRARPTSMKEGESMSE